MSGSGFRSTDVFTAPFASVYAGVMRARNFAFDSKLLPVDGPEELIVSIGNLSAGGTGKTPIVSMMVGELSKRGLSCGIVSRGYGGETTEAAPVWPDGQSATAKKFGDEPTWLAHRHRDVPVYVGADRAAVAKKLASEMKVDVIVADDAFQHRYLRRDVDIVLLDASQPRWHYRSLPLGRLREGFGSLARARYVFLTKTNLATGDDLQWLRQRVAQERSKMTGLSRFDVFEFEWVISGFVPLGSEDPPSTLKGTRVLLVSGIAKGSAFADSVRQVIGTLQIAGHLEFADHHRYTHADLGRIMEKAETLGVDAIVVTEKDAVKLEGFWHPKIPCLVSRLEARPTGDLRLVYEEIDRLAR
ncbi:MAG: tetraacyldisaccharide 4'-kinase [Bdellovibrionota bacterium]